MPKFIVSWFNFNLKLNNMEGLRYKRKSDLNKPMDFIVPGMLKYKRTKSKAKAKEDKTSSPIKALNDYLISNDRLCVENGNMFESNFSNNQFKVTF